MVNTPILFIVFNRPEPTRRVFEAIRKAKPQKLYVSADGPRPGRGEEEKCAKVRQIVLEVDWTCEVHTLFREQNLGCGLAVSDAISWFFNQVEEGIVLEDDCLPDESFFPYCEELLRVYRSDSRIFQISGSNFQLGKWRGEGDYYFSRLPQMWGWASWSRAWKHYQYTISYDDTLIPNTFSSKSLEHVKEEWIKVFDKFNAGKVDTWDYQWMYRCWELEAFVIVPNRNLVYNIGFSDNATHTNFTPNYYGKIKLESMNLPLKHPAIVEVNEKADAYEQKIREGRIPRWRALLSSFKQTLLPK